ncbi:MAG: glycogen/starch/alpha-glucan phosphorylase [Treponema sp.]|nr:glycogen/starch/alpha-glucan phosphorylase [Treponema sp.]
MNELIKEIAKTKYQKEIKDLSPIELHDVISFSLMNKISETWKNSKLKNANKRQAFYLSAEFLVGRAIYNNLYCTKSYEQIKEFLQNEGANINNLEEIEDAALGNGGLGRLAACFLDSAATLGLPLDGYGIRYGYGLFKQYFENGFQKEKIDDWAKYGDAWSIRKDDETIKVHFADMDVNAVPYDMPIIGYGINHVSTLRLWQAEPIEEFDFELFNNQEYDKSIQGKNRAEDISRVLYPNDSTEKGKLLRLKQQYFFSSASLQDILRNFIKNHGNNFSLLPEFVTIQLNDTHPVISIPELINLLTEKGLSFNEAFEITKKVFNYTNHTIMQEALEKWDLKLIKKVSPKIANIIIKIDSLFNNELKNHQIAKEFLPELQIIQNNTVHMAYLACYCSSYINGVAKIHTEILKTKVLKQWYLLYPSKFQNKTNGIPQRRWLGLCNPELSAFITKLLGNDNWITNLSELKALEKYADDKSVLDTFIEIKNDNKRRLNDYMKIRGDVQFDTNTIVDVQIKRLHEYKRQFLNILAILELYFEMKEGTLKDFTPTTFIFGAKAAPGYVRAKGIIKLINEVATLIQKDELVSKYIKIIFVTDYNVSYAEKIVAAANVSEQISTAGTEASGTGNMKLMLNGAVTLGTYDGANIEIVNVSGIENNYIFGAHVEDIEKTEKTYDPKKYYNSDFRIKRCLDALIDGTLDDNKTGMFKELYSSILEGASWHKADNYYLLYDFDDFLQKKVQLSTDYKDKYAFAKKMWLNMCNAGIFSSDRTISEYAKDIWKIK